MSISVTVHCPIHFYDYKVYGYIVGINEDRSPVIKSNGCEQCNNGPECQKCMADAEKVLTETFLSNQTLFHDPLSEDGR